MIVSTAIRWRVAAVPFALALALCGVSTASAQSTASAGASQPAVASSAPGMHAEGGTLVSHAAPTDFSHGSRESATPSPATSRRPLTTEPGIFPEIVNDPGFEDGPTTSNPYWAGSSAGGFQLIDNSHPFQGNYSSDTCGYKNCTDLLQDSFTVPDNVSSSSFSLVIDGACPADSVTCSSSNNGITLTVSDGSTTVTLMKIWSNGTPSNTFFGWSQFTANNTGPLTSFLQARAGRNVTFSLSNATISGADPETWIDNLDLGVVAPPNAPTAVTTTSSGAGDVGATWTAPSDAALNDLTGYTATLYSAKRTVVTSQSLPSSTTSVDFSSEPSGVPYYIGVASSNTTGTGAVGQGNSVTPFGGADSPQAMNATSTQQYFLPNSDGTSWQRIDETNLSFEITTGATSETVVLSGNADLWTGNAGVNQDLGICMQISPTATDTCTNENLIAWKESGGKAGTFSPNAAFVQTVATLSASTVYRFDLVWKSNTPSIGKTIAVGAGGGPYSPTSLTAHVVDSSEQTAFSTSQYTLPSSDGTTWNKVDTTNLELHVAAPLNTEQVVISGNADLWTGTAGINQDLGILISPAADCGNGSSTTAAWKESGGYAGTFSPNAAFVQTVCTLSAGQAYTVDLAWKANHSTNNTIFMAAGSSTPHSPTRLTLFALPTNISPTLWATQAITTQQHLSNSDGTDYAPLGGVTSGLLSPSVNETVLLSANVDLWTANAGVNQDVGIFVTVNGVLQTTPVGWKESGGNGGTFSPNAAFLQVEYPMSAGNTYTFSLYWKTNHSTGGTIFAGAGPLGGLYSPTRLLVIPA